MMRGLENLSYEGKNAGAGPDESGEEKIGKISSVCTNI